MVQLDVSDRVSIEKAAAQVKKDLGDKRLYALVNNAGIGRGDHDEVMRTNVFGAKYMCDAFIPLLDQEHGRIVNVGSGAGPMYVKK